jgi:hypothetical protein
MANAQTHIQRLHALNGTGAELPVDSLGLRIDPGATAQPIGISQWQQTLRARATGWTGSASTTRQNQNASQASESQF